jgi:hypothetical protein
MRLPEYGTVDANVDADADLELRLRGSFGADATVTRGGQPLPVGVDRGTLVVALPAGTSRLSITQPAIALTPCRRRVATIRVKASRGDRVRTLRVFINGRRVRSVHGRAARRAVRIRLPAARARVVARGITRKGRHLVRRRTYRGCTR